MRLVYKMTLTFVLPLVLTLGLWGWLSYHTMENKIHADTDLILKDYSDNIIMRMLSGKELPERFNGAYNTYYINDNLCDGEKKLYLTFDAGYENGNTAAILDALKAVSIPAVEVHISDVSAREAFRQISYPGMYCEKTITGQGLEGYRQAILYLKEKYGK